MSEPWVIIKSGYFYRPNRAGYTSHIEAAGLYTEEEAKREAAIEPDTMNAYPLGHFREEIERNFHMAEERLRLLGQALRETPKKPGFYWGRWMHQYDSKTGEQLGPAHEWEIMHVVDNNCDESDPEHLMVMVPGHTSWQPLDDFCWGAFISEERKVPRK